MRTSSRVKPVANPDDLELPLVDRETGAIRVGRWPGPLSDPNIEDATFPNALSSLADRPVLRRLEATYRRRWRLKVWQYMSIVTDGWFVAVAVADAGFAPAGDSKQRSGPLPADKGQFGRDLSTEDYDPLAPPPDGTASDRTS